MSESSWFTLGIEEEFQLIDPQTRDLRSHVQLLLDDDHALHDLIKPEMHQSVIEAGTTICRDIKDAKRETARFYFARILPRTLSHKAAIESGAAPLLALDEAGFID